MRAGRFITAAALALILASCSTTRVLPEGKYRLAANKVQITENAGLSTSDISPYIKQSPNSYFIFGWNPFLNIYNWSDGSGKGMNKVWEKIGTAPVQYAPEMVPSSVENIRTHLEYLGYYGSEVSTKVDTTRRIVKVNYIVTPGKRYPIDSLSYVLPEGNAEFSNEFQADKKNISVKEGDFLSEAKLEAESARSAKYFNNLGYYDFNKNNYFFEVDTLGGKALLRYEIRNYNRNESPTDAHNLEKYRFGNVTVSRSANINFRDNLIKKLNAIHPGDLYNEKVVNATYNRLSSLKLFNGVGVELNPTENATLDCDIKLTESSVQGVKANLEFSTNSAGLMGINPKLSWYHKNIFHGAEWLSVDFSSNFQFKPKTNIRSTEISLSSSLSFPHMAGMKPRALNNSEVPRTELKASYAYQNRPEYRRTIASFSYGYTGAKNNKFFYQLYPFRVNVVKLYDLSEDFFFYLMENPFLMDQFVDHIDMGVGGMLYYTTNSDIVPKTSYSYARFNFDLSGNVLRAFKVKELFGMEYSNYIRGELNLGRTLRFGKSDRQALAARFTIGAGYSLNEESISLPFEKMFFVGGASSMRGWQSRTLGPGFDSFGMDKEDGFIIPSQAGDLKMELDLEYRFPMVWKLEGALFAETGNVWSTEKEYDEGVFNIKDFYKSLAADWGFGLRVNLDFILLRLDMGLKLHDPTQPEGLRWRGPDRWFKDNGFTIHFGVGYPF